MFITSYEAPIQKDSEGVHYFDLSAMGANYRVVDIDIYNYTGTVDSDGHCHEFTGVSSYTSDLFIQGEEGECAYIALYKNQSISKLTDAIRITWGGGYGHYGIQYYIVSKQNSYIDLSNSNTITIEVGDSFVFYEKEQIAAAYETQYVSSYKLPKGTTQVAQEGVDGYATATYEVVYADGELVSRQLVETAGNTAIPCIVEQGTLVSEAAQGDTIAEVITEDDGSGYLILSSGDSLRFTGVREVTATAYTSGVHGVGTRTASGTTVHVGVVAVDRNIIPLGTSMFITSPYEGGVTYGYGHAEDTGVRGNVIDLYMDSYDECISFGRRTMLAYILE